MASIWSCVTYTVVVLKLLVQRLISARMRDAQFRSRLDSAREQEYLRRTHDARPIATRWELATRKLTWIAVRTADRRDVGCASTRG